MTQIQINRETEEAARKPLAVIEFCRYLTNRQDQANQQNRTPARHPQRSRHCAGKACATQGERQRHHLENQNRAQAIRQGTHRPARGAASGLRIKPAASWEENDALTPVGTGRGSWDWRPVPQPGPAGREDRGDQARHVPAAHKTGSRKPITSNSQLSSLLL